MHNYVCRPMKILKKLGYWILAMAILGFSWTSMVSRNSGASMSDALGQSVWALVIIGLVLAVFLYKFDMDE